MANYPGRRKGTRRIVVWVKGKRHEWIVRGSKTDGEAFEARERLRLDAGQLSTRAAPKFSEFCRHQYRPFAELNLKGSTWKKVRIYQLATLIEAFGSIHLVDLSTDDVERFKAARRAQVGATSVNNELRVLRTILRYARDTGYPCATPKVQDLKVRGSGRVRVWSEAELQRLFAEARKRYPELVRMFVFLVNTGCRKGEALAAEWNWIDFDRSMVRIPSNEVWHPKSGKPREVPMADGVRAVLSGPKSSSRWVFPNRAGERYVDFPKDLYWDVRNAAGLKGGPHTFRHTFASNFLAAVPDLFLLAQVLGHSTQRVTELYAHLLPEHLARARNAVNITPRTEAAPSNRGRYRGGPVVSMRNHGKRH